MLFSNVLNAEIVDDEGEIDGSRVVGPEGGGDGDWAIAIFGKMGSEAVVAMRPACFRPGMPLRISMYTQPSGVASGRRVYSLTISSGILERCIFMYSYRDIGVP